MPAIPVYKSSPINASKASGVTPKTATVQDATDNQEYIHSSVTQPTETGYPPAKPGAAPSLPVPTGSVAPASVLQPTPTQKVEHVGPPPPQPGAVPAPTSTARHATSPPKAGEAAQQQPPQTTAMPMPPQMSYPAPTASYSAYGGSSTTTAVPAGFGTANAASSDFSHPPGYHQNINATEFSSDQRAAHDASVANTSLSEDAQGVWGAAKKWAVAASESLAAAEGEVWKRINKE
ncbi:hypothetical protein S7711_07184 [Stachybotrys chartarum IBT 7711]|uniref:Uncharacterized protein n=1 Tax=Stachybotrys chartarum (strain CBS 109288 / IBT 7711) TaxID=1280523 RepID=A0A084AKH3_STACB|nr:hypothetical protein S7711_07184 [Stachybotrys chartarum IBT 7711]KFA55825.1 hypothetical protein S40293_01915 [Stachybotrys chartarum IBT 40293]